MSTPQFETVIGLEVHLQLNTKTKIFCSCENRFGAPPNTLVCPVCLGLPGSLPVLNYQVLLSAIKIGLALNCQLNHTVKFDRKNYYYPDLPKGYQISQFDQPIAEDGWIHIEVSGQPKRIGIKRAHLEEDAGKLIHDPSNRCSLVDYNRTGTPLMEIVSDPDLRSPQEAYDYLSNLKLLLQYLEVSDCDMEKGSLRCDANVSIRPQGSVTFGTKTELKNMNSFKAVKLALEYEINRHTQVILSGERIIQETRLWNDEKAATFAMRSKEQAHDYRYFPEPDLVPFELDAATVATVRSSIAELPEARLKRLLLQYKISDYDANILIQDKTVADYFEKAVVLFAEPKKICNWIIGPLLQEMNQRKVDIHTLNVSVDTLVNLIKKVEDGTLSNLVGKDVLKILIDSKKDLDVIIEEKGLKQVSDEGVLEKVIDEILTQHDDVVNQIKQGKESAIGFLVGQAMRKSAGKANPKKIGEIIKRRFQDGV